MIGWSGVFFGEDYFLYRFFTKLDKFDFEVRDLCVFLSTKNGVPRKEGIQALEGVEIRGSISPYLFILCVEALSALLSKAVENQAHHEIKVCPRTPILSHLLFVDDNLFFHEPPMKMLCS